MAERLPILSTPTIVDVSPLVGARSVRDDDSALESAAASGVLGVSTSGVIP
jgi:hypothetical protein